MSKYWELTNQEEKLIHDSFMNYREVFTLAVDSWDASICTAYFTDFTEISTPCVLYKTQADVALKQAITSILTREYAQAIYNIRLAVENIGIAIYGYADPKSLLELFHEKESIDSRVRNAANAFLEKSLPDRSAKLKSLHKTCDEYGSHQSLGHAGRYFNPDEPTYSFEINLISDDSPQLTVGLAGIVIGMIIEFDFAISDLGPVDWVKVKSDSKPALESILERFEIMKRRYRPLWEA